MSSTQLWIEVSHGWVRADHVHGVFHTKNYHKSPGVFEVKVSVSVADGSAEDGFGPFQPTFATAPDAAAAKAIARALTVHLLTRGDTAGIVVFRDNEVTLHDQASLGQ